MVNRHVRMHHWTELRLSKFHQDLRGSQNPWQHYSFNSIKEKVPICSWDSSDIRPVMQKVFSCHANWNGNVIILIKFSSLATPKVVRMTTFGAAIDENFVKMTAFPIQRDVTMYYPSQMTTVGPVFARAVTALRRSSQLGSQSYVPYFTFPMSSAGMASTQDSWLV